MRLLFAYTAEAYANSGFNITNSQGDTWQVVGSSPFLQMQNTLSSFSVAGGVSGGIFVYTDRVYMAGRLFNILDTLGSDEVLTFGYRLRPLTSWGGRFQVDFMGLWNAAGGVVSGLYHIDVVDNTGSDLQSFLEIVVDPTAKMLTGYVNGKKIRTVSYAGLGANINSDAYMGLFRANNNGMPVYANHFYAAVCKKSEGPVILGAWSCEDLVEQSNDLRDGDGKLTRNTVNETFKTVTYKAPAPGANIAVDIKGLNPAVMSKLITVTSDGKTSSTKEITNIEARYDLTGYGTRSNAGRPVASATPADDATAITVKLKAQYMQE